MRYQLLGRIDLRVCTGAIRPIRGRYSERFHRTLQVDGYAGYNCLLRRHGNTIRLAYCWSHFRRKLFEVTKCGKATPIVDDGLIRAHYRIEKDIRGKCPEDQKSAPQKRSKPLIGQMESWLKESHARGSAKSPIGEALNYISKYWAGLTEFLNAGRVEPDSNFAERTIRPIALNRKNALFAGHDAGAQNWAIIASMIETCKMNAVDPYVWLTQTLTVVAQGDK